MAPKKKAVNVKSSAVRKTSRKKRTRSPSSEPPPQLEPVDVEDTEHTELEVDIAASERDSTISRSDASDDGTDTTTATIPAPKRKNRKPKTNMARSLTKEEEDEVIEWLRTNRFLYDKSSFEFKNRQKKERACLEMDQKMRLNPGDLYRWYTSLRTQYVKEVKKKENATRSCAGAVNDIMTPRITWLLEKFEFVKQYVCQARATRGSKIKTPNKHSDCTDTSVAPQAILEGTTQSETTSATTSSISYYLDKVSQQLTDPKSDIEKPCDFLGMLMAKMTPSCLEEFTHEVTCKAMEYVKQSNLERHQAQQPPQVTFLQPPQPPLRFTQQLHQASQRAAPHYTLLHTPPQLAAAHTPRTTTSTTVLRQTMHPHLNTDYIMARNLAASNPPAGVLQQQGQNPWTDIQPANLQPILPDQQQPTAYSTPVCSGTHATNTTAALTGAFQTLNPNTSFNLCDYIPTTPKETPAPTTGAQ